ncbi:3'(2'),5'-bisphosphate nucleotidase CysQ [Salinispirillum sp. LH 10-3-1]|uniref:3'(2'),5'-bisphosphate nucleotidase CysQ n=1 Tax=Salinispirillum sp. LH 10-3-1 TaxID=2952525 RepID=A0AB38YK53_9GAMM
MLQDIIRIAQSAGEAIMQVYQQDFAVQNKSDNTPVTAADIAANKLIESALQKLTPDIPVLTEESGLTPWLERQKWQRYWLVDPLDGTKEFVKRNGDFTVNIALIDHHFPVLGVVYAPARHELWYAEQGAGAYHQHLTQPDQPPRRLHTRSAPPANEPWLALGSRSFHDKAVNAFLNHLGDHQLTPVGSAIKTCMIAAGEAHIYPRLGLTSEWDTAASQVIAEEAGALVINAETGERLNYNTKDSLLNPWFIAVCAEDPRWRASLAASLA